MIDIEFELGDYVENQLTNTDGYVNAIADHITGCTRVGVRPEARIVPRTTKRSFITLLNYLSSIPPWTLLSGMMPVFRKTRRYTQGMLLKMK